jgi:hypothetical protein
MGVADTSFPLYEKQWLNGLLGVLAFGGIQGACDFLFSTQGYGFLFYPAFLAFLFLCVAKGSTPEKGQESVLALFNAVLFLVFCAEYEVLTFSYPLWIFLSCGVFAFILAGRILVYTLDARLLWHYYVGLSFVSGYATAQAFKGESYEVSCLGILCFFLGFGLLTRFSKGLVLVLVLLGVGWKGFPERKNGVEHPTRPHVLLITVDTLRTDALSCYGGQNPTRFLDRLAQESVLYEQAYSTASWTLPSVLSIHTGLYPSANGVGIETSSVDIPPLSHEARPLALVLNQAGYRTIGMVSNYWFTKGRKLDIGFEVYRNFPYDYSPVLDKNPFYLRLLYLFLPPKSETSAVQLLKEAEQELKKGKGNYFLWIHLIEPHLPYGRDIDFSKYPESRGNLEDLDGIEVDQGDLRKGVLKLTPPAKKFLRWWYDQEVLRVDRLLEEFLGNLRQEGYLDNTMVLFAKRSW